MRSQLTFASQIGRPHPIKDIVALERVQRRVSKFILNDFQSTYKHHSISVAILRNWSCMTFYFSFATSRILTHRKLFKFNPS